MNKKLFPLIVAGLFCAVVIYLIFDTAISYSEISRNSKVIEALEQDARRIEEEILETRLKMERFRKDPKAAESLLRKKFEMLRKDQYYINDKSN